MPLTPWRSMWDTKFPSSREEMDRVFEDFFGDTALVSLSGTNWLPPADIIENEKYIVVLLDLPAMNPENITVSVVEDVLTIAGERKQEQAFRDREYYMSERRHGPFSRTITLPGNVMGDKATASYKDGVLAIKLPKSHEEEPKEIKINIENAEPSPAPTQAATKRRKK